MERQSLHAQRGEIEFRKKLVQQQVDGQDVFADELGVREMEALLQRRMQETRTDMNALRAQGIAFSPYVEIGAERGQRTLVLENEFNARGAAVDLSYDMLKSCAFYRQRFGQTRMPLRICCDAHRLPFASGSVRFVFCYETLHHFPDPLPVVKEIHRVLAAGGCFYLDEEPCRKTLHVGLYRRKKIYSRDYERRNLGQKVLDFFFSEMSCNEVEHGIIENHRIPVARWMAVLSVFDHYLTSLKPKVPAALARRLRTDLFTNPSSSTAWKRKLARFLTWLLGGSISSLCVKAGTPARSVRDIRDVLICPTCIDRQHEKKLHEANDALCCSSCGTEYPFVAGVAFLFIPEKLAELYPEVNERNRATRTSA